MAQIVDTDNMIESGHNTFGIGVGNKLTITWTYDVGSFWLWTDQDVRIVQDADVSDDHAAWPANTVYAPSKPCKTIDICGVSAGGTVNYNGYIMSLQVSDKDAWDNRGGVNL